MPPVNIFLPQVTRIPIAGPDPYNTLVCVSATTTMGPQEVREGHISRWPMRVFTPFRLAGFDQRVPPAFDHSTTAWISGLGPFEDGNWALAVDQVTGAGFSPYDGSYFVDINVAFSPDGSAPGTCYAFAEGIGICLYWSWVTVTSWVLCHEPPPPSTPRGRHVFSAADLLSRNFPRLSTAAGASTGKDLLTQALSKFLPASISLSPTAQSSSNKPCKCHK